MKELKALNRATDSFRKLPSVGQRSAERMAYAVLEMSQEDVNEFANALLSIKTKIHKCPKCGLYTENPNECDICLSNTRDHKTMIVVSNQKDVIAFEKLESFNGVYHVINGTLSAVNGISPADLHIDDLLERIKVEQTSEVIIATEPTIEGETTALYIARLLQNYDVKVTRLAYGLPMGSQLDYADTLTLTKALQGRTNIK